MPKNSRILVISDQHFPYSHPDIISWLAALKDKYKPTRILNTGDEIDGHSISFHSHDPDLFGPSDELKSAIAKLQPLYKLFPEMDILESNHGSLVYRKGKFHGLPRHVFKSYREILGAPKGWRWHLDILLTLPNGNLLYGCHGKSATPLKLSKHKGVCTFQGHYHGKLAINYWFNGAKLLWDAHCGCLIDDDSLAFAYNKLDLDRPAIGNLIVIDSLPKLLPMPMTKHGRWTGEVP